MADVLVSLTENSGNTDKPIDVEGVEPSRVRTFLSKDMYALANQHKQMSNAKGQELSIYDWLNDAVLYYAKYQLKRWSDDLAQQDTLPKAS